MIVNGVDLSELAKLVDNKTVVIVGPAATMVGSGLGSSIDSHDLVCRINDGYPVADALQADLGTRMDVLSHAVCEHLNSAKYLPYLGLLSGLIITSHPEPRLMLPARRAKYDTLAKNVVCPIMCIHKPQKMALAKAVGVSKLNGGMVMVVAMLACPLAKLSVCGFTCHTTPYLPGYKNDWNGMANRQYLDLFRRLRADDKRLVVDEVLAGIIKGHP